MMVDAHLTDGRTVFRLLSRGTAIELLRRDLETLDEFAAKRAWVRWTPQSEWQQIKLQFVRKGQVGFVRQVEPAERDPFLHDRLAKGETLPDVWLQRLGAELVGPVEATA